MADATGLRQQVARRAQRAQVLAANDMRTRYRRAAPYKTGDTQASVDIVGFTASPQQLACTAVATTPQALYTDQGTRPHIIRARRARVLRFRYRGRIVYARQVNHPGTKGTRWFSNLGEREWSGALQRAFRSLG